MKRSELKKFILLVSLFGVSKVYATTNISPTSPIVNPANITWGLESQVPTTETTNPTVVPLLPTAKAPTNQKAGPSFVLKSIHFIHQYPIPKEIQAVYEKSLNKPIDFQGVQALAAQIQNTYRKMGDILVRVVIPPQEIDEKDGILQLQIIEGQVQHVIFTGDLPKGAKTQLERYAYGIANENPVSYRTIDHFLALANSLPGISVTATLIPSKTVVGGADLVINVTRKAFFSFLSYNNYGTQYIGPDQAFLGAGVHDIFAADSFSLTGATSTNNPRQLAYFSGSYDLITGPYSTEINPVVSQTVTHPGNTLASLEMEGTSTKYTVNMNQPLMVSRTQSFTFISSLYHLNSKNMVFGNQLLYDDIITALTAGLQFKGIWLNSLNNLDAYTTVGMPILGAPTSLSNTSRSNCTTQFVMLDFDTSTIHYLTQKISFSLTSTGQITSQPLLSSEQLGFGGMQFGQGFDPYVISGDKGVLGALALRYDLPTRWGINSLQPQIFYDVGAVANNDALPGTYGHAWGSSAGLGLNLTAFNNIQVSGNLAKPLTFTQATPTPGRPLLI